MIEKLLDRVRLEPVKFNANVVQGVIAVLAFVAIVFFDQEQASTIAAAVAVIGLIEGQARVSRSKVSPVIAHGDEAVAIGGPGGDPSIPPLTLPDDYAEAARTGEASVELLPEEAVEEAPPAPPALEEG